MFIKIQRHLAVLVGIATLGACANLPFVGSKTDPEAEKTVAVQAPYIDYWQTRDPSEYRRATPANRTAAKKSRGRSRYMVFSGQAKASRPAPSTAGKDTGPRISVIMPVQSGLFEQATQIPKATNPSLAAVGRKPVATPKATRNLVASSRKAKRKPGGIGSKNLWDRVRGRSVLAEVEHPRIDEQIAYLKRNPGYLNLLSQRSRPFLHYIVEQIDRRGLPTDLALLPMVESGFQVTAVSPKEAAGLWQIIPSTGQEWGLVIAEGYDGRFDIHTSTDVALGYLRYLNKLFKGDWLLALAAYNAGPRAVQNAIEAANREQAQAAAAAAVAAKKLAAAQQAQAQLTQAQLAQAQLPTPYLAQPPASPTAALPDVAGLAPVTSPLTAPTPAPTTASGAAKIALPQPQKISKLPAVAAVAPTPPPPPPTPESVFWRLKLPKETQDYVPRILALSRIVANPTAYGLSLPLLGNQPYLFRVDVTPEFKIVDGLMLAGISSEDFFRFNPGFKPGVEPPLRAYNLLLPLEQAQSLALNIPGVHLVATKTTPPKKAKR